MKIFRSALFWQIGLSVLLGTIVFYLLPLSTHPEKVKVVYSETLIKDTIYFDYLNTDGQGKRYRLISFYHGVSGAQTVQLFLKEGQNPEQFNIPGTTPGGISIIRTGDFDQNDTLEIYAFYHIDSMLYMDVIFPYDSVMTKKSKKVFIDYLRCYPDYKISYAISNLKSERNEESERRVFFTVFGGIRTYYPRKLYALDLDNLKLSSSESFGNMIGDPLLFDFDGDGTSEIFGPCGAPGNLSPGDFEMFDDHTSWFMVFSKNLKLINDPIPFPGERTAITPFLDDFEGNEVLMAFTDNAGQYTKPSLLIRFEGLNEYKVIDTLSSQESSDIQLDQLTGNQGIAGYSLMVGHKELRFLNQEFVPGRVIRFNGPMMNLNSLDLNRDGKPEVILQEIFSSSFWFFNPEGKLICKHDFGLPAKSFQFGDLIFKGENLSFIQGGDRFVVFSLVWNGWHYLKWLALVGLIGFFYLFSWISIWIQKKQTSRMVSLQEKMRLLELQSVKNQLDPHFTFNALNVLTYLSSRNDHEGVENFTHHFSKLLRRQVEMSDKPSVKLFDEVRFIQHYVELQKLRFEQPILLDIDIDRSVDMNLQIPKMMIYTHVENAIKHGLLPRERGGEIRILVNKTKVATQISIIDDGVGRKTRLEVNDQPEIQSNNTGKGLSILNQLYDLYYQLFKVKITQEIIDLKNKDGLSAGTEVRIVVPHK